MQKRIVIIEDEEDLLEILEYNLQKEGFIAEGFTSTKHVEQFLQEEEVHLLIVDRNLSGVEGSEFIAQMRRKNYHTPVIFLSAKDQDKEIEEGFLRGGDDYITKPYNQKELLLRIRAILRRTGNDDTQTLHHRDLTLDANKRLLYIDATEVELTKLEFDLLYTLMHKANQVLSRDTLLAQLWSEEEVSNPEKTVNVAINRLKKKIDPEKNKHYIKSIRGIGYQIA